MSFFQSSTIANVGAPQFMSDGEWDDFILHFVGTLDNAGISRTADSGQYDPYSVTRPGTTVYEVREFGPYKIRIEHQSTRLRVVAGTATDGAGSITAGELSWDMSDQTNDTPGTVIVSTDNATYLTVVIMASGGSITGFTIGTINGQMVLGALGSSTYGALSLKTLARNSQNYTTFDPCWVGSPSSPSYFPLFRQACITSDPLPQEVPWLAACYSSVAIGSTIEAQVYGDPSETWFTTGLPVRHVSSGLRLLIRQD